MQILGDLDSPESVGGMANRMSYSESQFVRIAKQRLGEPPMSVRRRLLLERAAYRITRTGESITEIGFDAGFESLEGFGRSFRAAFGVSPSAFRKLGANEFRIDLTERLHYIPTEDSAQQGSQNMNVIELMTEHHCWEMERILGACKDLSAEILDAPSSGIEPETWREPTVTLREMLGRAAAFAAPWMEAINNEKTDYCPAEPRDIADAIAVNRDGFLRIVRAVDRDQSYDLTFVDSGCEPPMVFTYSGILAHALTNAAYRRICLTVDLQRLGVVIDRMRDPIDFPGRG